MSITHLIFENAKDIQNEMYRLKKYLIVDKTEQKLKYGRKG